MSDRQTGRPSRPPPPPPALPVRAASRPPPAPRPVEAPTAIKGRSAEWKPLPWPTIMRDAVPRIEGYASSEPDQRAHLLNKESSWIGMMTWCFGVVVLLLVVMPTAAIPKLLGPFSTPVSGAQFGPLIAMFAMFAMIVAVGGGLWIWTAMGREDD